MHSQKTKIYQEVDLNNTPIHSKGSILQSSHLTPYCLVIQHAQTYTQKPVQDILVRRQSAYYLCLRSSRLGSLVLVVLLSHSLCSDRRACARNAAMSPSKRIELVIYLIRFQAVIILRFPLSIKGDHRPVHTRSSRATFVQSIMPRLRFIVCSYYSVLRYPIRHQPLLSHK